MEGEEVTSFFRLCDHPPKERERRCVSTVPRLTAPCRRMQAARPVTWVLHIYPQFRPTSEHPNTPHETGMPPRRGGHARRFDAQPSPAPTLTKPPTSPATTAGPRGQATPVDTAATTAQRQPEQPAQNRTPPPGRLTPTKQTRRPARLPAPLPAYPSARRAACHSAPRGGGTAGCRGLLHPASPPSFSPPPCTFSTPPTPPPPPRPGAPPPAPPQRPRPGKPLR